MVQALHFVAVATLIILAGCVSPDRPDQPEEHPSDRDSHEERSPEAEAQGCREYEWGLTGDGWVPNGRERIDYAWDSAALGAFQQPFEVPMEGSMPATYATVNMSLWVRSDSGTRSAYTSGPTIRVSDPFRLSLHVPHVLEPGEVYGGVTNTTAVGGESLSGESGAVELMTSYVVSDSAGIDLTLMSRPGAYYDDAGEFEMVSRFVVTSCEAFG